MLGTTLTPSEGQLAGSRRPRSPGDPVNERSSGHGLWRYNNTLGCVAHQSDRCSECAAFLDHVTPYLQSRIYEQAREVAERARLLTVYEKGWDDAETRADELGDELRECKHKVATLEVDLRRAQASLKQTSDALTDTEGRLDDLLREPRTGRGWPSGGGGRNRNRNSNRNCNEDSRFNRDHDRNRDNRHCEYDRYEGGRYHHHERHEDSCHERDRDHDHPRSEQHHDGGHVGRDRSEHGDRGPRAQHPDPTSVPRDHDRQSAHSATGPSPASLIANEPGAATVDSHAESDSPNGTPSSVAESTRLSLYYCKAPLLPV